MTDCTDTSDLSLLRSGLLHELSCPILLAIPYVSISFLTWSRQLGSLASAHVKVASSGPMKPCLRASV